MQIVKLPAGEPAPPDTDCIRIQERKDGQFLLEGSVLFRCGDIDSAESVSLVGGDPYPSYDDAEAAGLAWADDHCVETLHLARSAGTQPLPDAA
ncbi:hypothetical protein [Sphingomonas sp.]|jgi:hypothetical protein|uniref:hypothetical protein n=1 Tax=Sphingomonas sp. TaxID=28214 RepID=UPI00261CCF37|nr:hypothetical protein [Sphingomonas sp.]MDF2493864.1 hypothetical protein [Sphingomonas sp.]